MGEYGHFEKAQNVQCGKGIVLLRTAFHMLLLIESLSANEDGKGADRSQIQCKRYVPWTSDSSGLLSRNLFLVRELR